MRSAPRPLPPARTRRGRSSRVAFAAGPEVDLAAKVDLLKDPASYPDRPQAVEVIETHMAWVFLTDTRAYKLKKPVRYVFLDFATLAARKLACDEELRLNRRLAPDVYLDVVPLARGPTGGIAIGGPGTPIEWLVEMRRLPRERMLDAVVLRRDVDYGDIRRLGLVLAGFYRGAQPADLSPSAYVERVRRDLDADLEELARPDFGLATERLDEIGAALWGFADGSARLLRQRASAGRVVEGHGDLRPEHVCLEDPPVVIDCIEFNRDFRTVDAADDLALLQLECERLGDPRVGAYLMDVYTEATGDAPPVELMHFYMSRRACLRAKLAAWHTTETGRDDREHWLGRAQEYLRHAAAHAATWSR